MRTYDSFAQFVEHLVARLTGPMHFRLILQPLVAIALGIRDGLKDARAGRPPFVMDLFVRPEGRRRQLKQALQSLVKPLIIAIVLDAVAQYLMFRTIYPGAAVFVGVAVMGVPYSLARGLTNRIVSGRTKAMGARARRP
jgi:hypothetical protein